ncbi:ABC transporter ATP-binding protein, partial [bacterium]|nr:ABC transporter ATP-binding protein [bacterium]
IGLIYPFLIMIINPESILNSIYYQEFIKLTGIENFIINILILGFLIVSMFLMKNIVMITCVYMQNLFVINWKNDINKMLMKYYLNAPYKKLFDNNNSEKIYNTTVLSSQTLETFVLRTLVFITNVIIVSIILTLLLIKYTLIAIFTILSVIFCMYFLNKFFKHKTEILAPKMLEFSLKNNNQVIENIKNLKDIRIFGAEDYFLNKFEKIQCENNRVIFKNAFYSNIPPYIVEMILVIALILLAGFITYKNIGETSRIIASYGVILAVILRIAPSLNRIQVALNHMNSSKDMIKKINKEYEKYEFDRIQIQKNKDIRIEYNNKLVFKDISFSYTENKPVIKNITFDINKGEFVGIVGLSGAGKTTIADILTGILPPDSGEILIDETEITKENIYSYRRLIGYVPQEMNILDDTYKHNVAWGMEYYNIDDKNIEESLKQAQLYDFVEKNGGINSIIKGLSQGQKQRLLIARALYRKPEIILFDEATSALDLETENEITQMITNLKGKNTIIAIAHRLTTLKECDKIIYLKEGEIVDIGTFEELKNKYEDFEKLIKLSQI